MKELVNSPLFAITVTFVTYFLAQQLYARKPFPFLSPVLVSIVVLICLLKLIGLDYHTYNRGGKIISFFLGPAVVALGVPLYEQLAEIKRQGLPVLISIIVASVVGVVTAAGTAVLLGASTEVAASLAPKSVTTPIAIGIAEKIGGIPSLTAALVIAAGVLGAVAGPAFLKIIGITDKTAFGLAMGAASHGIGTARAMEEGRLEGAASGLAIGLNGLATAVVTPFITMLIL